MIVEVLRDCLNVTVLNVTVSGSDLGGEAVDFGKKERLASPAFWEQFLDDAPLCLPHM